MGIREEHLLKRIFDRQMDIHSGYLVYFDDVCMNEFVQSYVTNVGISVGMGSASVTLTYAPQFKSIDTVDDLGALIESEDGIQNGTCLRIFAENIFSKKYHIIFDGIIKSRSLSRTPQGLSLVFSSTDYMYWLSRSIIPITIPVGHQIWPGERIRWKGQGVFVDNLKSIAAVSTGSLVEKTITEYWNDVLKKSLMSNSTVYSDNNSVASFDDAANRVSIMGDINPELVKQQVLDLVITANAVFADTAYTALNNVTSRLLLEFFQDIDGVIRVKPPFWNEPVLKNHIIDPIMIKSGSENTNWNSFYTRVISQGGLEEWESSDSEEANAMFTPIGVYVGEYKNKTGGKWADYLTYDGYETLGGDEGKAPAEIIGGDLESACWGELSKSISNRAVICGIMANINAESKFDPDEGTGDSGHASGLFQWRNDVGVDPTRWDALKQTAKAQAGHNGVAATLIDVSFQIKYFLMDIGYIPKDKYYVMSDRTFGDYTAISAKLKGCPDSVDGAKQAAQIICEDYEKPQDKEGELLNRSNLAEVYFNSYGKSNDKPGSGWDINNLKVYDRVKDVNKKVTANFTVKNLRCKGKSCGCSSVYIAMPVVKILQSILDNNPGLKINITSAYRCDTHNDNEGGSKTSLHRSGAAIDFQLADGSTGMSLESLYEDIDKDRYVDDSKAKYRDGSWKIGELIYYPSKGFIHIAVNANNSVETANPNGG